MKKYRDEIAMVCHDLMKAAQSVGAVSDAEMKEFEQDCFVSKPDSAEETHSDIILTAMAGM